MKYIAGLLKRYPLSTALALVIWVLCLAPLPETPLDNVRLIDKWTHLVMFGSLTAVIWWEYLRRHRTLNPARLFLLAFLAPVVMGGLVELAQAHCTGGRRSGEWFDFLADSLGVVLGTCVGVLLAWCRVGGILRKSGNKENCECQ